MRILIKLNVARSINNSRNSGVQNLDLALCSARQAQTCFVLYSSGQMTNYVRVCPSTARFNLGFTSRHLGRYATITTRDERRIQLCLPGNFRAATVKSNRDVPGNERSSRRGNGEPLWFRAAVSGLTELLRVFCTDRISDPVPPPATKTSAFVTEDIVAGLRQDYARAYFLTGDFLKSIYTEDCVFADPTIQFSGRDLYKRNLKLLVPFFEDPLLTLDNIKQGEETGSNFIEAFWQMRVYLKLPWKPFISVDGRTKYSLNAENKIVEHAESWNVTGFEAVRQIFKPSERAFWNTWSN